VIANRQTAAHAASLSELLGIDAQATEWMQDAVCAQTDPDAFHPDMGVSVEPAKAVCAGCPVLAECRAYALETGQRFGVWGGLSANERQKIRNSNPINSGDSKEIAA
jgi:WhiB family redox-sensing transcriptional regulator